MKQIIQKLWMCIAMLCTSISASAYDFEVGGIYYSVVSFTDFTCRVTSGENEYKGNIVIPAEVEYNSRKLKVIWIGSEAFKECASLTSVTIPNSVTYIGESAFSRCSSLASVTIPNSVTEIGKYAFSECSSLASVTIPNSVTEIEYKTFSGCSSLASVTIPNSVTEIGGSAFKGCSSLTSVTIPNSVTEIGGHAFSCSSLTSINLPKSINIIGDHAFSGCTALKSVTADAKSDDEGDTDKGTYISFGTFENCTSLESVTIPGNVDQIWQYDNSYNSPIFGDCESLRQINFPFGKELQVGVYYGGSFHPGIWYYYSNEQIEKIYIDRELNDDIPIPNVTELVVGEHVEELDIKDTGKIAKITISATTPPSAWEFTNPEYMNAVVKVPFSALEAYKAHQIWGKFWNLQGFDPADIDGVEADFAKKSVEGRYDLNGTPVDDDYRGVVIIRFSDGSTKKVMM